MVLSKRTIDTLIDLVEIRLSCIEVHDREDARELANLERCLGELRALLKSGNDSPGPKEKVASFPGVARVGSGAAG